MSDDKDQDKAPEEAEELDPQALADSVADGVSEAEGDDQALADEWAAAMEESGDDVSSDDPDEIMAAATTPQKNVRQVELDELEDESVPSAQPEGGPEMDVILDISGAYFYGRRFAANTHSPFIAIKPRPRGSTRPFC